MLYKYLPFERIDILENLNIRFSPLLSLNDPFESLPLVNLEEEKSQLHSELILGLDELWNQADKSDQTESNRMLLEQAKVDLIKDIKEKADPNAVGQMLMELLGDNFGVLSLSRTEKSLLMWSHYADEGRGFVIGFDDNHPFFRQRDMEGKITKPLPVVYSAKRRKVIPGEESYYQKLLCEKPLEWAYEEEERLFRTFLTKENAVGKDLCNQDIVLSELPKESIKVIFFGYQMLDAHKHKIMDAICTNKIECSILVSNICDEEYKVVFDEVKKK
ncbi:DUF2971 domain-containing protein [Shewanella frigidimarina]|uniref:DUF2971 domain-containing protein n=1 Tax=Shewanella frigidimarina TaxID=56812 RepID=UPI003D7A8BF1